MEPKIAQDPNSLVKALTMASAMDGSYSESPTETSSFHGKSSCRCTREKRQKTSADLHKMLVQTLDEAIKIVSKTMED
jgi:hypothetical protein